MISAYQYHYSIKAHVAWVVLLEKKNGYLVGILGKANIE